MKIANLGELRKLIAMCQQMTAPKASGCCPPAMPPAECKTHCETLKPDSLNLSSCCKPEPKCC